MKRKCDLCGAKRFSKLCLIEDGLIEKCVECSLVTLSITDEARAKLEESYKREFFDEREEYFFNDGVVDGTGEEKAHIKDFRDGLGKIARYAEPPGRLLDVGCAVGSFLQIVKADGQWQCQGVEISEYAANLAAKRLGIDVFAGTLKAADYPDESFDVVTMWDILEHMDASLTEMREVARILKPGGVLLVNTPNEAGLLRKTARFILTVSGGAVKGPIAKLYHRYHLCYYNEKAATLLLNKAGFTVLDIEKKPIPPTRGRGSKLTRSLINAFGAVEKIFGSGYELFYIARKD